MSAFRVEDCLEALGRAVADRAWACAQDARTETVTIATVVSSRAGAGALLRTILGSALPGMSDDGLRASLAVRAAVIRWNERARRERAAPRVGAPLDMARVEQRGDPDHPFSGDEMGDEIE